MVKYTKHCDVGLFWPLQVASTSLNESLGPSGYSRKARPKLPNARSYLLGILLL